MKVEDFLNRNKNTFLKKFISKSKNKDYESYLDIPLTKVKSLKIYSKILGEIITIGEGGLYAFDEVESIIKANPNAEELKKIHMIKKTFS